MKSAQPLISFVGGCGMV